ncbi:phage tail spike protein, partial [Bacillus cereus]|uniref:phage tail spike protein n=1 Tax=Bacillus cereus TaxID=1396 RepID=UPI003D662971
GDNIITIEKINNGLPYITNIDAFQRWNEKGKHKFGFYSPETDNENMSPERLKTLMEIEMKKCVNASVSYEVKAASIGRVFGLAHELINEGDTIRIKDTGFTPKLYLEARAIAGDESFTDPSQDKYVFGDYREITDPNEEMRKLYNRVLASLGNKANKELLEQLEILVEEANKQSEQAVRESQVAKDIAEATKTYMEQNMVDIIEQPTAPTENLRDGKTLWIDNSDPENKVQKLWKDGQWQRVTPDTGPLQQSINDAQIEINTLKNTVKDLPDTTWVNQQLEGKADKSGVYTKDYIDQNLVGKQVYETDKQGNIQKFTDMKTEIDQNAEAITHKAEKTQVDTISNNLNQVTQTANTAKQTAESNTNTISSLQTTVSNINDNVTNLLVDSGTFEGAKTTTPLATDRWWFKNNGQVRLSADTYQGNAVIETQTAWNSLAYNFKDLVSRGVVKAGDKVNYSVCVRVKNLANGQSAQQNFYFRTGATGIRPPNATNQWQRVSVSFTVTPDMMTVTGTSTDSFMRIEPDVVQTGTVWYQQSTPQLTIGDKVYTWRPAPEDNATFVKKSNEIKQTVDSNVATIQSIQKDQGSIQSTLNEVKQTTDSNSQTIATLSQTQGQQGAIIQQNTSDITQLNNQIKSKVSDTQMQEYVGGLGSTNVLFNAAFEDRVINAATGSVTSRTPSTTKWSVVGTGSGITIVPESARHHEGYNSVKITATGQTASKWSGIMQKVPAVQNGGDYVFSAWVYVQDKNTLDNGGAIKLQFFNGANAVSTFAQTEIKDLLVNNSWVLVSVKISSPNVAITHLQGDIWVRQNGTIWVSQPQLQQGYTRSTFMENPKDYANYDQLVGEIAKKVATSDFNSKVSTIETSINQQSNRIDFKAEKTDVYNKVDSDGRYGSKAMVEKHESSITLMSNEINSTVKKGDIISSINQTAEQITIDVSKLAINAATIVKWLTAEGIDTNFISVRGDKITIDKNGVTVKMLDFLFEDEWGTKTTAVSRRNLIADPDFSSVTKKNIGNA